MTTLISPLLQESLAIDAVLAHRGRLPGKVGATGVALETKFTIVSNQFISMYYKYLEQERLAGLIPSTDQERDSKGPHLRRRGSDTKVARHLQYCLSIAEECGSVAKEYLGYGRNIRSNS